MIIKSIDLKNFRNYELEQIGFDENTNILYGDNAQGKTNVLEAIYVAGTTKSHKASNDADMIRFQEQESHIKMIVEKKKIEYRIDLHLRKNKAKGIAVNGIPLRKTSELFGIVHLIFFSPEDLSIIKNGPSGRRKFMDMELCQMNKFYVNHLIAYNKAVNQRNQLLKDLWENPSLEDTLDIWDLQVVEHGLEIIQIREQFLKLLNTVIEEIHKTLTGGKEQLCVRYEPSVTKDSFLRAISEGRERDKKMRLTGCGPHRDDILFTVSGVDIRKYGSQGQQRTAALSLKLAEIELVKRFTGDMPVLLLDDVLSELDHHRQNYLLDHIHHIQTVITCTGLDELINRRLDVHCVYKVKQGKVYKENELQEALLK